MPHSVIAVKPRLRGSNKLAPKAGSRFTVGLPADVARQVEKYAQATDSSMSKAIAGLVRIGLEGQDMRKKAFLRKLKANLANADPRQEDQLIDEFRALILGR